MLQNLPESNLQLALKNKIAGLMSNRGQIGVIIFQKASYLCYSLLEGLNIGKQLRRNHIVSRSHCLFTEFGMC